MSAKTTILEAPHGSEHVTFSTWLPSEKRVEISGNFCEKFGLQPRELWANAHAKLAPLIFPDDLRLAQTKLHGVFTSHSEENFTVTVRLRDIHQGWREVYTAGRVVERDLAGHPIRLVCYHVDITDTEGYHRYKSLVNKAPMGVFATLLGNPEIVVYTNDHFSGVLEAFTEDHEPDRHAFRNRPLGSFMSKGDVNKFRALTAGWPAQDWDRTEHLAPTLQTRRGNTVDMHFTITRGEWDGNSAWLIYALDVSEVHRREIELKRRNDELDAFAYTITHDLRAPIITVRNFLGYLESDVRDHPKKQFRDDFQRVSKAAARLDMLLQGLLELSRIGRADVETEVLSLRQELERIKESLAAEIEPSKVRIELERHLPSLRINQTHLLQLFQNLLQNALRYRNPEEASPYVRVGVTPSATGPVFYVRDNGLGIDVASREKVFEIFKRLKKTGEGAGIGLSIVRRIVEHYGGRIWIASNEIDGAGAEFHFTLPKAAL